MRDGKGRKKAAPEEVILGRRRALRDRAMLGAAVRKLLIVAVLVWVLFGLFFGVTPMKGGDMEPRLSAGDLLLYFRLGKKRTRNEIVIMERDGKQYVGRLIGLPGETLSVLNDGAVSIDDNFLYEENIFYETKPDPEAVSYPLTLGPDEYFLLADKRDTAKDSRYFGPVSEKEIKGRVITALRRMSP